MLRRTRYEQVVRNGAGGVRINGCIQVKLGRQRRAPRGPELQRLVKRAGKKSLSVKRKEIKMGDPMAVAAPAPILRRAGDGADGFERVSLVLRARAFKIPQLDGAVRAAGEQDAAVKLFQREAADSGPVRADVVRALLDDAGTGIMSRDYLAIETMLWCWRKGTEQVAGDVGCEFLRV